MSISFINVRTCEIPFAFACTQNGLIKNHGPFEHLIGLASVVANQLTNHPILWIAHIENGKEIKAEEWHCVMTTKLQ